MKIELTIQQAREIYTTTKDEGLKKMLEANFSKEDLSLITKPESWFALGKIGGYFVNDSSIIVQYNEHCKKLHPLHENMRNVFKTKEQAEASIALAQLSQLMAHDYWNGNWKPDWNDDKIKKWCIDYKEGVAQIHYYYIIHYFLVFQTSEKAKEFLISYKELIEQAKPLL